MDMDDDSYEDQIQFQDDDYQPFSFTDNDIENQKFLGDKSFKNLPLSTNVKEYFQKFKKSTPKSFMKLFNFKDEVQEHKSVCAKPIERGETIAQCYDCATDHSCIQCMDCFKNSNHEGHKVIIKKAYGGCCDCGDAEAWKKSGFCTKHTGEIVDIQIDSKEQDNFISEMKQLFFLLFWQSIQQNSNNCRQYSKKLLQCLCYLNEKGVYYNKLTCLVFGSKVQQNLMISKNVNSRTILANILCPKVAKNLNIDDWMDLFFSMFQYYPFKKLLLSTYMNNFSVIYGDEQSQMRGSSISCQLLTSFQLVRQYALEEGSVPIGSDIKIEKIKSFERTFYMLCHDLDYFTKLSGDTPQVYFKFHMNNRDGILKMFEYRKIIKNQQDKEKQEPDILQLARFVKYFQIEFKILEIVSKIAGILQKDKETLEIIIKTLYEQALKQQNERKMIIFKPLTRALTIFLFSYFDLDLKNLFYSHNQDRINKFVSIFGASQQDFRSSIEKLFKICVQSYLFHAKTLAEPGLNSTLYVYIFCYKMKNRLISSVDILGVKMLSMMHNWPQIHKQSIIQPEDYLWQVKTTVTASEKKLQIQTKIQNLQFILSQLNLVTASQSNELYVAYDINHECGLYQGYVQNLLLKILNQQKSTITLATVKQYEDSFFHKNVDLAHNYLKKFCTYDKSKKAFILNKHFQQNNETSANILDYSDFRCNLTNKSEFLSPQKTLELIKESGSEDIFNTVWSAQTIKNFTDKSIDLMKQLKNLESQVNLDQLSILQKLRPLFSQLTKIIYLKMKITSKPQELNAVLESLQKTENITSIINSFYEPIIFPQKMEQEKGQGQTSNQNEPLLFSPEKLSLQKTKSNEDQRKRKLKERMELKKKAIKQNYAKKLAKFEQQQKIKLQKEEEKQQVEHKLNCIICKNQQQQDLVYFVSISFKNHERLLNLGDGITCLSIQSCYHSVDLDCYKKLASQVSNKKRPTIKCPFCKFRSNTFLPIQPTSKNTEVAIKNFETALLLLKNIDEVQILEEIVKSFYHYALLGYLDPQRTLNRRFKVYRILLQILKVNSKKYRIDKVYDKFIHKKMNFSPKFVEQQEEIARSERLLELNMILQNSEEEIRLQDLSQDQIEHLLQVIGQSQDSNSESSNSNHGGMLGNFVNKIKQKFSSPKKEEEHPQATQKYTTIFKQTLMRLFKFLQIKQIPIQQQENNQKIESEVISSPMNLMIEEQLSTQLEVCLKKLFEQNISQHGQHHNSIYEDLNENNNILKLRDLPLNFKPLGKLNKCCYCEEITSSMTLCLLCDWQGCLKNCCAFSSSSQKGTLSKKGGTFNHSKAHGEQSLFLLMQTCMVCNITSDGLSSGMGCIYKDEWGNQFSNKKPWEDFFLDEGELNKIKITFLHQL